MKTILEINNEKLMKYISSKAFIIQRSSSFKYGKVAEFDEVLSYIDDIIDAHFFDEQGDLHLYWISGEMKATYTSESSEDEYVVEYQMVKDNGLYDLGILKALKYDEYGQVYVEYARPYSLN